MRALLDRVPSLPFAAGITCGILLHPAPVSWWMVALIAAASTVMLYRRYIAGIFFISIGIGWLTADINRPASPPDALFDGRVHAFHATVRAPEVRAVGSVILDVTDGSRRQFKVMALSNDASVDLYDGQQVRFRGTLVPLRTVADAPHARVPDMKARAAGCMARVELDGNIEPTYATGNYSARCRVRIERWLVAAGADDAALGLFSAILLGDDSMIDNRSRADFRAAGVAHALALSGFHIGFVAMLAGILFYWMRLWQRAYYPRIFLIIIFLWGYAAITGFGVATVRACIMLTVYLLTRMYGVRPSAWNALFLSVALILAVAPQQLYSPGFLLSVSAVAGILAFAGPLNPFDMSNRAAFQAVEMVAVPVAAMMGTCVVTVCVFHKLPAFFIFADIFIVAIFPLLMLSGILMATAGALGLDLPLLKDMANGLVECAGDVTAAIAGWGKECDLTLFLTWTGMASVMALIVAAAIAVNNPVRKVAVPCVAVMIACVVVAFRAAPDVAADEIFVVPAGSSVAFVMRHEGRVSLYHAAGAAYRATACRELNRTLEDYLRSRGCDCPDVCEGDFTCGPFARRGAYIFSGKTVTGVPADAKYIDSIAGGADYVLLTNQCKARAVDVFRRMSPDTLILAPSLSEKRRIEYSDLAASIGIPIIDMSDRSWAPVIN